MLYVNDHLRIEERSLAMHRAVVSRLRERNELLNVARDNLARWQAIHQGRISALDEWKEILLLPLEDLFSRLTEVSEEMIRLRQSSPFCGILSPKERWAIYESFATRTYYSGGRSDLSGR